MAAPRLKLALCAKFNYGESDYCWKRLRGTDGGDLRRARCTEEISGRRSERE
jgi:hypothetical protein